MELTGKVVIVTGASSGIGEATARLAHHQGARVVLAGRRVDRLTLLREQLPGSLAVPTDVTDSAQIVRLRDRALQEFGSVDVLVNNAGQGLHVPLLEVDSDDFRAVLELNVLAPLAMMQAVLPAMTRQGAGSIVNVSSGTSLMVLPGLGAYAATKSALNMLSKVAREEFAPAGVVVSLVYPGITKSEFHDSLRAGHGPTGSTGHPAALAELVAEVILDAVRSGDPEVRVRPPQP
jgi:NAD(P)-dependent dehydrogenase (short-subunit alcohol dehydrogenase family)